MKIWIKKWPGIEPVMKVSPPDHLLADSRAKDGKPFWEAVLSNELSRYHDSNPDITFEQWLMDQGWGVDGLEADFEVTLMLD